MTRKQYRILVVDDEDSVRLSLMAYLEDVGYDTYTAQSAEDALVLMESVEINLAIIDIRLPGMNGNTLINEIHKRYPHTKFLIHTGSVFYNLPLELSNIGIRKEDILIKPINDMQILVHAIESVIKRGKQND